MKKKNLKKTLFGAAAAAALFVSAPQYVDAGGACPGGCNSCASHENVVCAEDDDPFMISLEYLLFNVRNTMLDYAMTQGSSGTADIGDNVHQLDFGYESGVRARVGYNFDNNWQATFTFSYIQGDENETTLQPSDGTLFTHRHNMPNGEETEDEARASADFDLFVYDFEMGYHFRPACNVTMLFKMGFRIADMDQSFDINYDDDDFIRQNMDVTGYGAKIGMDLHWDACKNWSIFGRFSASLLAADFEHSWLESENEGFTDLDVEAHWDYWGTVPVLEAALGISYHWDCWNFEIGYEFQNWFNVYERVGFNGDVADDYAIHHRPASDVGMDGLFIRADFKF